MIQYHQVLNVLRAELIDGCGERLVPADKVGFAEKELQQRDIHRLGGNAVQKYADDTCVDRHEYSIHAKVRMKRSSARNKVKLKIRRILNQRCCQTLPIKDGLESTLRGSKENIGHSVVDAADKSLSHVLEVFC